MRPSKIKPLQAARVAYLKCRRVHQLDIAKSVGLGPATVSRLLSAGGEAQKYIKPPEFDWTKLSASERAELRALDDLDKLSPALAERLCAIKNRKPALLSATVVLSKAGNADDDENRNALPRDFYEGAARVVWELLTPAQIIGITWGRTLFSLLQAAKKARLPVQYSEDSQPTLIPLCGESLGTSWPSNLSSSVLAQQFGEILTTQKAGGDLSLNMIPVFLPGPRAFDDEKVEAVKKLLGFSSAYAKIFGDNVKSEDTFANKLDIVITSISRENMAFGADHPDPGFTWDTLKLREFEKLVIGDLAGIPLPRPGASEKDLKILRKRWTGLQEDHLRQCAIRASTPEDAPAGVIVVGEGSDRAACIVEAVRRGLVNHVVVDESLAHTLIDRLKYPLA